MVPFLLSVAVLGLLIGAGYRLNMYLYTRGAVGVHSSAVRQMQSVESFPLYQGHMQERDYGLRYARAGLLLIAAVMVVFVSGVLILLLSLLH